MIRSGEIFPGEDWRRVSSLRGQEPVTTAGPTGGKV